jgi:uncharacterized lipoprotein YmbA
MPPSRRRFLALAPAAILAACGTSPNPNFYTLVEVPGQVQPGGPTTIQLRRIGLAGYLDRAAIVFSTQSYRLQLASDDRWGEPLGGMLQRVLNQDFTQRLPHCTVFSDGGAITADPAVIVEIDLQRLDGDASGVVILAAEIAVRPGDSHAASATRTLRLTVTPASGATSDYVAALSSALGQLADAVAAMLQPPPPPPPAAAAPVPQPAAASSPATSAPGTSRRRSRNSAR